MTVAEEVLEYVTEWRNTCRQMGVAFTPESITQWLIEDSGLIPRIAAAAVQAERDRLPARIEAIPTHNDTPPTSDNLNYAARHPALCGSWTFDVLTGLAALLAEERGR